ncbi:MAG: glycoside hydrolase family 3 protein [Lentisphaerae bacterium]|nr:MAG: glycoside hydrolase family 3 protein [Lentisphaerota bacterium]
MKIGTWFPVSIMLASTWNAELVERVARAMGHEMKMGASLANAGPAMNIIRDPRGGHSFEYFTEDPYLNGRMAVAYVKGLQSQKVMANLKHFLCNNQERNRGSIDVKVSERALREIYLPGFRDAILEGDAASVMGAYNKLNGVHCCETPLSSHSFLA